MAAVTHTAPATATVGRPARRVATFITADVAQSELAVAADGQLPDLHLTQQDKKAKKQVAASTVQWRIVVLVCASLTLSVLMMTIGGDEGKKRGTAADEWRAVIKRKYIGSDDRPLENYQIYLRKALVAHSSGDYNTERAYYRKVLRLLWSEQYVRDPEQKECLTRMRHRPIPDDGKVENDEELEQLMNLLISAR
jgi:predicted lipid-binding transport protein (Tim44 family)